MPLSGSENAEKTTSPHKKYPLNFIIAASWFILEQSML
jgi:hypothetical protein